MCCEKKIKFGKDVLILYKEVTVKADYPGMDGDSPFYPQNKPDTVISSVTHATCGRGKQLYTGCQGNSQWNDCKRSGQGREQIEAGKGAVLVAVVSLIPYSPSLVHSGLHQLHPSNPFRHQGLLPGKVTNDPLLRSLLRTSKPETPHQIQHKSLLCSCITVQRIT